MWIISVAHSEQIEVLQWALAVEKEKKIIFGRSLLMGDLWSGFASRVCFGRPGKFSATVSTAIAVLN